MSADFARVKNSAAASRLAGLTLASRQVLLNAWRTSVVGGFVRGALRQFEVASGPERTRWCATTLAVAAAGHLGLRLLLSPTVAPGLPAPVIAGLVIAAAVVAWKAPEFHYAWRSSRLARLIR